MVLKCKTKSEMYKAFATSDFYQLLAQSIQFPTIELVEAIMDGRYIEDGLSILKDLSNNKIDDVTIFSPFSNSTETSNDINDLLIQMKREYSRLFNNPESNPLPIYETTFLKGDSKSDKVLFVSSIALDVEKRYNEAGVNLVNGSLEPADFLGTELEFMMYLYCKKGQAIYEQDEQLLKTITIKISNFETMHIKQWVYNFFDKLAELSPNTPYLAIAKFAQTGLNHCLNNN